MTIDRFQSLLTCKACIMADVHDLDDSRELWDVLCQNRNEHDNDQTSRSKQPEITLNMGHSKNVSETKDE